MRSLLLLAVLALAPSASAASASAADGDGDALLDEIESNVCGRAILREHLVVWAHPFLGDCEDASDYALADASALGDADGDGLADGVEDVLCGLEDRNDPKDGACVGDDYVPNFTP